MPQSTPNNQGRVIPGEEHLLNIQGLIRTIDFVPTAKPTRFIDQFYIVTAGGSSRAYLYDIAGNSWKYTTLT